MMAKENVKNINHLIFFHRLIIFAYKIGRNHTHACCGYMYMYIDR